MITTFQHKGLSELFANGRTAKIDKNLHKRAIRILDALDRARSPSDMAIPGFDFHPLKGFDPVRYTTHVNGPWCITFEFEGEHAAKVNFEQYH